MRARSTSTTTADDDERGRSLLAAGGRRRRQHQLRRQSWRAGPDCPAGSPGATDTIVLGAGTYTLTGPSEDSNASGDLDINADGPGPVAISGAGEGQTTIGSDGADRVIELLDGTLDINDLTITGGVAPIFGGGIFADGNPAAGHLSLTDVTVSGNSAPGAVSDGAAASRSPRAPDPSST